VVSAVDLEEDGTVCPECGEALLPEGELLPYHDAPKPARALCPGSKKPVVTWEYDEVLGDMRCNTRCGLCEEPALGMASINGQPFCHTEMRSCYEDAQRIMARRRHPSAMDSLLDVNDLIESLDDNDS